MHPFRLCETVMIHKSNLQSYKGLHLVVWTVSLVMHFVSAIAYMYKVSVRDKHSAGRQKGSDRKAQNHWCYNSEVWLKHDALLFRYKYTFVSVA